MASLSDTLRFVFDCGIRVQFLFYVGTVAGIANGLVFPILAYLFSASYSSISAASHEGLSLVRELSFSFMAVGAYALVAATIQSASFETVAYHASTSFKLHWFRALLRQDASFFDVYDVGGMAAQVGPLSSQYRRGVGRKFGEGIQFGTTAIGGMAFGMYSSWRISLVILSVIPLVSVAAMSVLSLNQTKGARAAEAYKKAGSVAYSSVSAIKTVLSLNAVEEMIRQYKQATQEAFHAATSILIKQGFANGT
jgi:ATP-binding cassette, subfamily B (MDR/TAP), member 1